jgi:hypothetical protein
MVWGLSLPLVFNSLPGRRFLSEGSGIPQRLRFGAHDQLGVRSG